MKENIEFNRNIPQPLEADSKNNMRDTGTSGDYNVGPLQDQPWKTKKSGTCSTVKKIIYFSHFLIIALLTTHVLIQYPHAREFSFTLCALILFGYMAIWTIIMNFIFLVLFVLIKSVGKQNWAVMFDRLFIKFVMMLWPIFAAISYAKDSFLNITEVAYFSLYMCVMSLILVVYELYVCIFAEHENPEFIFRKNDLTISDDMVWNQRKLYNQNIIKRNKFNIDA